MIWKVYRASKLFQKTIFKKLSLFLTRTHATSFWHLWFNQGTLACVGWLSNTEICFRLNAEVKTVKKLGKATKSSSTNGYWLWLNSYFCIMWWRKSGWRAAERIISLTHIDDVTWVNSAAFRAACLLECTNEFILTNYLTILKATNMEIFHWTNFFIRDFLTT